MMNSKILITSLCSALGVIAFIEMYLLLPIRRCVHVLIGDSKKAVLVMRSRNISDNWKGKVIPRYSRHIMASSFVLTFYLLLLFLVFGVVFSLSGLILYDDLYGLIKQFEKVEIQIITVAFGLLYAFIRNKVTVSKAENNVDYTFSSRLLHHMALGNSTLKEMAFDIDCTMAKLHSSRHAEINSPVFIAGLARAGTTILLEALYSTGEFSTLTYRDMPFVTAPYIWNKITRGHRLKEGVKKERAHGDRLYVNYESPEAFEEVFWMTFSNAGYVKGSYLELKNIEKELLKKYTKFIGNIIARKGNAGKVRYLAKNNNNLMRIKAIKSAFTDAIIIVPFRNPMDHAKSLHNQHKRFLIRNNEDPFSLKYMNWLGHFEFGTNFKPFKVCPEALPKNREEPKGLDYWIRYWQSVYEYVLEFNANDVILFDYDSFCEKPDITLVRMERKLFLREGSLAPFSKKVRCATRYTHHSEERELPLKVKNIYKRLQSGSL